MTQKHTVFYTQIYIITFMSTDLKYGQGLYSFPPFDGQGTKYISYSYKIASSSFILSFHPQNHEANYFQHQTN